MRSSSLENPSAPRKIGGRERRGGDGGRSVRFGVPLFCGRLRERHAAGGRAPGKLRPQGGVRRDCRPGFGRAASRECRTSSGALSAQAERRGASGRKRVSLPGMSRCMQAARRACFRQPRGAAAFLTHDARFSPPGAASCGEVRQPRASASRRAWLRPRGGRRDHVQRRGVRFVLELRRSELQRLADSAAFAFAEQLVADEEVYSDR